MSARKAGVWILHVAAAGAGVWWGIAIFDALAR
jgi:hypothetical protein